jgi:polar amino acid transport system substrate-binding protein
MTVWLRAMFIGLVVCSAVTTAEPAPVTAPASKVLRFVVYHPHFPPYIFSEEQNEEVTGIIPDLLASFFAAEGIDVRYLLDNRSGAEQRLYKGEVDAMMLSPAWAMHPERLIFSVGILPYRDYLYARTPAEVVQTAEQLQQKAICTRQYFVYPKLEQLFSSGDVLRLDSSSQEAQLRMVLNKRCDLVYINDLIARWLLQQRFANARLYPSTVAVGQAELRIALHPRWQPLLAKLNTFLQQQRQNGELQRLVSRYVEP